MKKNIKILFEQDYGKEQLLCVISKNDISTVDEARYFAFEYLETAVDEETLDYLNSNNLDYGFYAKETDEKVDKPYKVKEALKLYSNNNGHKGFLEHQSKVIKERIECGKETHEKNKYSIHTINKNGEHIYYEKLDFNTFIDTLMRIRCDGEYVITAGTDRLVRR